MSLATTRVPESERRVLTGQELSLARILSMGWLRSTLTTSFVSAVSPTYVDNEQALISLKLKKTVDAEGWCTKAVVIEGG